MIHSKHTRRAWRGVWFTVGLFRRWLKQQSKRLSADLNPWQLAQLAGTHGVIRPLEAATLAHVEASYHTNQLLEFWPSGKHLATVILAVGLGQKPAHAYWLARRLAKSWNCRVLILNTPAHGNVDDSDSAFNFFYRIAWLNLDSIAQAVEADYAAGLPIIGLGFSKGGQDVTLLAKMLLEHRGIVFDHILTLSTPWQGSRLWKYSMQAGGHHFKPGSDDLFAIEAIGQQLRTEWGVQFSFFCALAFDHIVHRSDARFRRPAADKDLPPAELKTRWYFAKSLWLQFGHTALFNGLVNIQMGLEIQRIIARHAQLAVQQACAARRAKALAQMTPFLET